MYSLQFNLVVTNLPPAPKLNGRLSFTSMLYEKVTAQTGEKALLARSTGTATSRPPQLGGPVISDHRLFYRYSDGTPLLDLTFSDSNAGLIGVGWMSAGSARISSTRRNRI